MDYEKKYKEALMRAREVHRNEDDKRSTMEFLFPELKENEDEKIRKYLIDVVNDYCKGSEHDGCIAWLEKQGEKKIEDKPLVIDEGKSEMDYCFTKMMNGEKINSACILDKFAKHFFELGLKA